MRIVHQSALNSYSQPPEIHLLASPRIAGLLPAQTPRQDGSSKRDPYETNSEDVIEPAVIKFRQAMIRVAAGKLAFADLVEIVSDLYMQVHPTGRTSGYTSARDAYPPGLRLRSLDEMNQEIMDKHGNALRYLAQYARGDY